MFSSKLEKLTIKGFKDATRQPAPAMAVIPTFVAMFNPTTITTRQLNKFTKLQGINTQGRSDIFISSIPNKIDIELILDGTGVTDYGISSIIGLGGKSVAVQVNDFLDLCFRMNGDSHEPSYLTIMWGEGVLKHFNCRLESVDTEYTLFDTNGAPLHAVLKTTFVEDIDSDKGARILGKNSPDLTHSRIVKSGDTLPLLSKQIYGTSQYYLRLAQINNLNDFRNLTPGQEIIFPPLKHDEANQ